MYHVQMLFLLHKVIAKYVGSGINVFNVPVWFGESL